MMVSFCVERWRVLDDGTQPRSLPEWCCSVLGTLAGATVRRGTTCRELFVVLCGVDTLFDVRWRRRDGTCSGGACKREGGIASRISWSWETDDGFRKGSSLECMNAGSTGDGGDVLWEPFSAGDGSPREGNPLLPGLSVDVRESGDVKRAFEMVFQGGLS